MPLSGVNHVYVRPRKIAAFEKEITALARRAAEAHDRFRWTAHQSLWGRPNHYAFVYQAETFADAEALGTIPDLWQRVYRGDMKKRFRRTNACIECVEHILLHDRPDLSFPPHAIDPSSYPYYAVTQVRARPGQAEACEELIRKLAEAIPKAEEATHLLTYQNYFGNLAEYWAARPLTELGELDGQLMGSLLLEKAFGPAEGGLLWRAGTEAVEFAHRELLVYRPELSYTV